ncbi:MAG: sugar transferase, partial [Planctomycetaceae bacterium]|nr:sugar transferase [Planctomycetaceae bacterium]
NREVIFPDKVRLNRDYIKNYTFWTDIIYIWKTVFN